MQKISFTVQEKYSLGSQHKICRDEGLSDRINVILLCTEGGLHL